MAKLLHFVKKDHPILRDVMPDVQDFKNPALQELINDMCFSILPEQLKEANGAHKSAAGMAANQWGIKERVFLFTPGGSEEGAPLEVMINPSYTPYVDASEPESSLVGAYEGCFSVPLTTGIVFRHNKIMATYYNPVGEKIERLMEGWEARVFQHETDHLNGKLFDGTCDSYPGPHCVERVIFQNKEEMDEFWVKKEREGRREQ